MTTIYFVQTTAAEQKEFLCRWVDRFFSERKRVRILVDSMAAAQLIDRLLWTFSQQSFIPHAIFNPQAAEQSDEPVMITPGRFRAAPFDALVCDCETEPEYMSQFDTAVHFILDDEVERKNQSRLLWRKARDLGLDTIHVPYEKKG